MPAPPLTIINVAPGRSDSREAHEREMWRLIAFSRGLLLGFTSAFAVFDWALLDSSMLHALRHGVVHVASGML